MSISCIIVDDEPLARNLLKDYVSKVPFLNLLNECSSPVAAIEVLTHTPVDLLFLDIQMPEITGLTLLKILPRKPLVILTTAYSQYALESYELDVVDYLLKPITFERFLKGVNKVSERLKPVQEVSIKEEPEPEPAANFIFVKDGTKLVKIFFDDILYIEGLKDYVIIHSNGKRTITLQRIKNLEMQLPSNKFIRIHNSYIVNMGAVETIYKEKIQIGLVQIPISDTYRKQFKEFINRNNISPSE